MNDSSLGKGYMILSVQNWQKEKLVGGAQLAFLVWALQLHKNDASIQSQHTDVRTHMPTASQKMLWNTSLVV
ncbi:unnamed protein product [Urochloa humidicola]